MKTPEVGEIWKRNIQEVLVFHICNEHVYSIVLGNGGQWRISVSAFREEWYFVRKYNE